MNLVLYSDAELPRASPNDTTPVYPVQLVFLSVPNSGYYAWTVPDWLTDRNDYFFAIWPSTNPGLKSRGNDFALRGSPLLLSLPSVSPKCGLMALPNGAISRPDCRGVIFLSGDAQATTPTGSSIHYFEVMVNTKTSTPMFNMFMNFTAPGSLVTQNFTKEVIASDTTVPVTDDISIVFTNTSIFTNNYWVGNVGYTLGKAPLQYTMMFARGMSVPFAGDGSPIVLPGSTPSRYPVPPTPTPRPRPTGNSTNVEGSTNDGGAQKSISGGAIAGAVIGSVLGATALVAMGVFVAVRLAKWRTDSVSEAAVDTV